MIEEQNLSKMGIYELRYVARALGDKRATSKKRDELIKFIMEQSQNDVVNFENNNKGRPVKNFLLNSINKDLEIPNCNQLKTLIAENEKKIKSQLEEFLLAIYNLCDKDEYKFIKMLFDVLVSLKNKDYSS